MKINHIGIVVQDLEKGIEHYEQNFNFVLLDSIFLDPLQRIRGAFLRQGDSEILVELLEPLGKESPLYIALKKGGGLNHICYEVENLDQCIKSLQKNGNKLISGPTPAVAYNGRKVAFLYTRLKQIIELVEL